MLNATSKDIEHQYGGKSNEPELDVRLLVELVQEIQNGCKGAK